MGKIKIFQMFLTQHSITPIFHSSGFLGFRLRPLNVCHLFFWYRFIAASSPSKSITTSASAALERISLK